MTPTPSPTGGLPPGVYAFPVSTGPTQNDACINTGIDVVLYGNKQFWFDYNPTDTFYLRDGSDWDTIALRFNYKNTDCCKPYYEVKEIDFNGLKATRTGDFWIFNKS
jgi:hypothetical protein